MPVAAVRPLRLAVLRAGGAPSDVAWPGDDEVGAGHFAVRVDDAVVAVATVIAEPHPIDPRAGDFRLRGMATDPSHRGRGYGAALASACVAHARTEGAGRIWLQARPAGVALYARAGFLRESEEFEVPGLGPHVRMALDL